MRWSFNAFLSTGQPPLAASPASRYVTGSLVRHPATPEGAAGYPLKRERKCWPHCQRTVALCLRTAQPPEGRVTVVTPLVNVNAPGHVSTGRMWWHRHCCRPMRITHPCCQVPVKPGESNGGRATQKAPPATTEMVTHYVQPATLPRYSCKSVLDKALTCENVNCDEGHTLARRPGKTRQAARGATNAAKAVWW